MTAHKHLYLAALIPLILIGCSSSGSQGTNPHEEPDDLEIYYCRAIEIDNFIHVQWAANHPTSGDIRYGIGALTQLITIPSRADTQDVVLIGLYYQTEYIYRLSVTDSAGNEEMCDGGFTTPDKATPEPVIFGMVIDNLTETSARVSWETDEPATTVLRYGTAGLTESVLEEDLIFSHEVELDGLTPSTLYVLRPEAVDEDGFTGFGPDTSLTTAAMLMLWLPDTTLLTGDTIDVPVQLSDAQDLAVLQYMLKLSSGLVEIVDVLQGPFYYENEGFQFLRDIRSGAGEVVNQMSWSIEFNGDERVGTEADGVGVVAYLSVRGLDAGVETVEFTADSTFGLDMFANVRACSLRAGNIEIVNPPEE